MELYVNVLLLQQAAGELESHAAAMSQLSSSLQTQSGSVARLGMTASTRNRLASAIADTKTWCAGLTQLAQATETISNEYRICESKLAGIPNTIVMPGLQASIGPLTELELDFLDRLDKNLDGFRDVFGFVSLFSGSEWAAGLYDSLHDAGDIGILKVAGGIDDFRDFVDFLNGDKDKGPNLLEKYGKKIIKKGAALEGPTSGVYANLYWNLAENTFESIGEFKEDPSLTTLLGGVVSVTAGTFFEAGADLAESTLDFAYGLFGQEFDKEDFHEAMDFLWDASVNAAGDAVEFVGDLAVEAGKQVAEGIGKMADAVGDGLKVVGDAFAEWLHW